MRLVARSLVAAAVVAVTAAPLTTTAWGDPVRSKNSLAFPATCDGRDLEFVTNGNGAWTPAHVVGTNEVFHPTAFDISGSFTPTGGETEEFTFQETKKGQRNGRQDDLVTCEFEASGEDEEGEFNVAGTVTGFFSPGGGADKS